MAVWPALHQSDRGSSANSEAGQLAFSRRKGLGEDWCMICVGWLGSSSGIYRWGGRFRSAPSWRAPRRTLVPAFPRYLAVLHRHWLSPPWSGPGPPGVRTADRSERQTDASPGGLRPVAESKMKRFIQKDTDHLTCQVYPTVAVSQYRLRTSERCIP